MKPEHDPVGAVISSPSGILASQDSFQHQWEPSYFTNAVNDVPSVGCFLANMGAIAIDDRVSERTNDLPTVSHNNRRGQRRACLVLLVAGARDRHVHG